MFKLLLVEDNLTYRATLNKVLLKHFPLLDIEEAGDKDQALLLVDSFDPDLILMDIHLPRCNGLDLTRTIKLTHDELVIIILTSHDLPEYRNVFHRFGADYFISKQTALSELFNLVEGVISENNTH